MKTSSLALVLGVLSAPLLMGQGSSGCSAGVRQRPLPATTTSSSSSEGSGAGFTTIKIQPEDVTTVSADGDQFYADLKGTSDETVAWEIVGDDLVRDAVKTVRVPGSRALLKPKDAHAKLVRLTPLPEARHEDWITLKACSVERPDVCDVKSIQLVKDEGLSCLQEIVNPWARSVATDETTSSCDGRDTAGALQTGGWSQEMTAGFGLPVDDSCNDSCRGGNAPEPWTLAIRLCGTFFPDCKVYELTPLKNDWKHRVRHLQLPRDPEDPDGCPDTKTEEAPCWMTCDGTCAPFDAAVKNGDTLAAEGRLALAGYLKDVCSVSIEPSELGPQTIFQSLAAALENASLAQTIQCAEGVLLTATQVIPWVETVARSGILRDETGEPYTADQVFTCAKKLLKRNRPGDGPQQGPYAEAVPVKTAD